MGKKAVMAVTGIILFGYVILHLFGNLQIFLPNGRENIDHYAVLLHSFPAALWAIRCFLILAIVLHIWSYADLGIRKLQARPAGYVKKNAPWVRVSRRELCIGAGLSSQPT